MRSSLLLCAALVLVSAAYGQQPDSSAAEPTPDYTDQQSLGGARALPRAVRRSLDERFGRNATAGISDVRQLRYRGRLAYRFMWLIDARVVAYDSAGVLLCLARQLDEVDWPMGLIDLLNSAVPGVSRSTVLAIGDAGATERHYAVLSYPTEGGERWFIAVERAGRFEAVAEGQAHPFCPELLPVVN